MNRTLVKSGKSREGKVGPRPGEATELSDDSDQTLTERAARAGVWNFLLRTLVRAAGFLRTVIFARLLGPNDIGQFGIALLILSIVDRFSHSGLHAALIQKEESIEEYLDTAWTVQLLRTIALSLTCLAAAPLVAAFFGDPLAAPLVRGLSVYLFLRGLASPAMLVLRRKLEFHRQFLIRSSATIANLAVSVAAALLIKSAWALMIGLIASAVATVLVSHLVFPYRPRFRIDRNQLRELSTFGRWVFINNVLFFLAYRGDNLVVGKLLGTTQLGLYLLAFSISEAVTVEISRMMTEVAMPAYSRAQGSVERVRRGFLIASELVLSLTAPTAVVLFVLAEPITLGVLGERYLAAAAVIPALAIAGSVRCFTSNASSVFTGLGRPDLSFHQNVLGVVVTYLVMFPLANRFGLVGVGIAVLAGVGATFPFALFHVRRMLDLPVAQLASPFVPAAVLALTVLLSLKGVLLLAGETTVLTGAIAAGVGALTYGGVAWLLWNRYEIGPLRVRSLMKAKRGGSSELEVDMVPGTVL